VNFAQRHFFSFSCSFGDDFLFSFSLGWMNTFFSFTKTGVLFFEDSLKFTILFFKKIHFD
jgi:hypothetical protein